MANSMEILGAQRMTVNDTESTGPSRLLMLNSHLARLISWDLKSCKRVVAYFRFFSCSYAALTTASSVAAFWGVRFLSDLRYVEIIASDSVVP